MYPYATIKIYYSNSIQDVKFVPIKFSEQYNVDINTIREMGVFDAILDVDSRVFIDPALLGFCKIREFKNAKAKIQNYFSNIILLLSNSKSRNDQFWKKADQLLRFKELSGSCCGYSEKGTGGNAIGNELRKLILLTAFELISAGEKDPAIFELLGVFQEKIGCDRISDIITFILAEEILLYTARVIENTDMQTYCYKYKNKVYKIALNPYNDKPLLLLPQEILSPLPVATSYEDIEHATALANRVRADINAYFDLGRRKKLKKAELDELIRKNEAFRRHLIDAYRAIQYLPYDFIKDPAGEYIWYDAAKKYVNLYPLHLDKTEIVNVSQVLAITRTICHRFKALIEDNGLNQLLFDQTHNPKRESAAQLLFYGIADAYCTANNIDLTKEGNSGRGPVDFKLSSGAHDKVVVETKLTSNNQLLHGFTDQVPIYMKQENAKHAIYLIIDTGHPVPLKKFLDYYNGLDIKVKRKISCIVIDATPKISASKA